MNEKRKAVLYIPLNTYTVIKTCEMVNIYELSMGRYDSGWYYLRDDNR